MTVASTLPAVMPNRTMTRAELVLAMNDWIETWPAFAAAIDEVVLAFNFNSTNATSTDSLLIEAASKSLNVGAGKSFWPGMAIVCAYTTDPTRWMKGEVLTYNSGTGALTFQSRYISDNVGTYAAWSISMASIQSSVLDSYVRLTGNGGHGSTNTKIRLLTTTTTNTGTAFTVAHSATLGTSITVNEPGIYTFSASDSRGGGLVANGGFTLNTSTPTSSIASSASDCIGGIGRNTGGDSINQTVVTRLAAGDVIHWKDAGLNDGGIDIFARKIGNV